MLPDQTLGRDATFTIPMVDANGEAVDANAVAWEVFDQEGVSVTAGVAADFTASDTTVKVIVPASAFALEAGTSHEGFEIVLTASTSNGDVDIRDFFVIVNSAPLTRFANTLLTYPEAIALRRTFGTPLSAWDGANQAAQVQALLHAHVNLSRATYAVRHIAEGSNPADYAAFGTGDDCIFEFQRAVRLNGLNAAKFDILPEHFRKTIKRAQLVEADILLGGDAIENIRRDGIISETIGESSTFYSSKPYLNLPFGRRTYELLKPYIRLRLSVSR